jgi:uncharacterized membrane protein YhaH (DUF805 family)
MAGGLTVLSWLRAAISEAGRSNREQFVAQGLAPLAIAVFALLAIPAFPQFGKFGMLVLIAAIYLSRVALAQAMRRSRDLGQSGAHLRSWKRQAQAYGQIFLLMIFLTTFQTANLNQPVALIVAAIAAASVVFILFGGPKVLMPLVTRPSLHADPVSVLPLPTPSQSPKATYGIVSAQKPRPSAPAPVKTQPAARHKPIVRKRPRGAIGEWDQK